jgi:hypothetical protein
MPMIVASGDHLPGGGGDSNPIGAFPSPVVEPQAVDGRVSSAAGSPGRSTRRP